jgi:hypothetical protein
LPFTILNEKFNGICRRAITLAYLVALNHSVKKHLILELPSVHSLKYLAMKIRGVSCTGIPNQQSSNEVIPLGAKTPKSMML